MKHSFLHLDIWKLGRELVKTIYILTKDFPSEERFGLTAQIRKSAVSVPSNIAEGCGRGTNPQLKYFLEVAIGSLCELETQIYLSFDLSYISEKEQQTLVTQITQIRKMTMSFKNGL